MNLPTSWWSHLDRFGRWSSRVDLERKLAFGLTLAAVLSGIATVASWTGAQEFGPDPDTVLGLLILDTILLLALGALVARQLVRLWTERRRGLAGSGLHVRIVLMFSLVAVTPAILVAVFSALFLNFGIQAWFSERVRTAIEASNAVAQAYLEEHRQSIRTEAFAMANDLNREAPLLMRDLNAFDQRLDIEAQMRSLSEAMVVDGGGRVVATSPLSLTLELELVPWAAIEQANLGQVAVLTNEDERVRAVVKLNRFIDAYLVVGRFIDPAVLEHISQTEVAVAQYRRLEARREGILITFVLIFVVVALLLLLAAVWIGLTLATQITRPISTLITAAERVRKGDLSVRVDTEEPVDEIGTLSRAFNRMTSQLQTQQEGLVLANQVLDERRRFTEAVLTGVSAGVIGLDAQGVIELPNRSALELLGISLDSAIGRPLVDVVPEMADLMAEAIGRPERQAEAEVKLLLAERACTFIARIVAERSSGATTGFVLTFDDISALVAAERKAAWADVARRIAHEIKNPLTPIQLASERLKRKYLKEIRSDPATFAACTDTIARQVEDIGRMVDEFSAFSRMPRPEMKMESLNELVRQVGFLERNRNPEIRIELDIPTYDVALRCDGRQVSQALSNLMKNATEAIAARKAKEGEALAPGLIRVALASEAPDEKHRRISILVEDNGCGLPSDQRDRLTEPYVTTHSKGTGLGLAIVKKIMEDHGAELHLADRKGGGARVSMIFYAVRPAAVTAAGGGGEPVTQAEPVSSSPTTDLAANA
ncbi:MAG: PAS domain-containing sensor histidine kinase [Rhodospirillales bacterium]|nr:PAS domain-containing sensor histidine kinase [Rhodospirillales bacterium]